MSARDLLADAQSLLAAASSTEFPDLKVVYVSKARTMFTEHLALVESFRLTLEATEREMARQAKAAP